MLTQEAIDLLLRVKAHILEEPRRLSMDTWFNTNESYIGDINDTYAELCPTYKFAPCGTVACIAGWTVLLHDGNVKSSRDISIRAAELLGLNYTPARRDDEMFYGTLFYPSQWDEGWYDSYKESETVEQKAIVAADYIDHFIKTRGPQPEISAA